MSTTNHAPTPPYPESYAVVLAARGYPLPWSSMMSVITAANNVRVARLSMPKDTTPGDADLIAKCMADSCNAVERLSNSHATLVAERDAYRSALWLALERIEASAHGDNCFVSAHYDGDPGNACNCGKDSIVAHLADTLRAKGCVANEHFEEKGAAPSGPRNGLQAAALATLQFFEDHCHHDECANNRKDALGYYSYECNCGFASLKAALPGDQAHG